MTESGVSSEVSATTVLPEPNNLTASEDENRNIVLSWVDSSDNEDSFIVYRSQSSGTTTSDYTQIDTLTAGTENYTDTNVSLSTQYFYRVSSTTEHSESLSAEISETVNATTISGTVNLSGSGVANVTVYIVNDSTDTLEATANTDTNGNWSTVVDTGNTYHVAVQYDDGMTKYNADSKPYIDT